MLYGFLFWSYISNLVYMPADKKKRIYRIWLWTTAILATACTLMLVLTGNPKFAGITFYIGASYFIMRFTLKFIGKKAEV